MIEGVNHRYNLPVSFGAPAALHPVARPLGVDGLDPGNPYLNIAGYT